MHMFKRATCCYRDLCLYYFRLQLLVWLLTWAWVRAATAIAASTTVHCYGNWCLTWAWMGGGQVGYSQGLNFLVAVLLLHMREEQAFWVLVQLMRRSVGVLYRVWFMVSSFQSGM